MSESLNIKYSFDSTSILLPPYSGKRTLSPGLTLHGTTSPFELRPPGPTATTVAFNTLLVELSGKTIPPFVVVSLANRSTITRSNNGNNLLIAPDYLNKTR
jgi:hypothetical protein